MNKIIVLLCILLTGSSFIYYEHTRRDSGIQSPALNLSGTIENNFRYKVSVEYVATKDSFWCKHHTITPYTYTKASRRIFEYYPAIKNKKHSINLSLSEFSPNKGCQYRPIRVNLWLAPQSYEALRKNILLVDPQYINKQIFNAQNEPRFTSKVLSVTCFPIDQSTRLADNPNKHWICYQSPQKNLMYDFDPNKNLELTLNIRTISKEKYKSSCFHWSAHHKEKCQ